ENAQRILFARILRASEASRLKKQNALDAQKDSCVDLCGENAAGRYLLSAARRRSRDKDNLTSGKRARGATPNPGTASSSFSRIGNPLTRKRKKKSTGKGRGRGGGCLRWGLGGGQGRRDASPPAQPPEIALREEPSQSAVRSL